MVGLCFLWYVSSTPPINLCWYNNVARFMHFLLIFFHFCQFCQYVYLSVPVSSPLSLVNRIEMGIGNYITRVNWSIVGHININFIFWTPISAEWIWGRLWSMFSGMLEEQVSMHSCSPFFWILGSTSVHSFVRQLHYLVTGVFGGISPKYNIAPRSHLICN